MEYVIEHEAAASVLHSSRHSRRQSIMISLLNLCQKDIGRCIVILVIWTSCWQIWWRSLNFDKFIWASWFICHECWHKFCFQNRHDLLIHCFTSITSQNIDVVYYGTQTILTKYMHICLSVQCRGQWSLSECFLMA